MADPTLSKASTEADINSANQWMWQQPWYQQTIQSFGQQMGNVKLNSQQKKQLAQVIAQHGFPLPDNDEIDPSGNVNPKGHKMRNFLIAAAIGGATIATMGAAGVFAGAAGAGTAGASGAAGAAGAAGAGAGAAGAAGAAGGALGATSTVGAIGALAPGLASGTAAAGAGLSLGGAAAGAGALGTAANVAKGASTLSRIGSAANELGTGISNASSAAGNTRRADYDTNVEGQRAYESELMNRATMEAAQRKSALQDVYRASYASNPRSSPYNPAGPAKYSPEYLATLDAMKNQGVDKLKNTAQYDSNGLPVLAPYQPTKAGTLERAGNWIGPTMSTIGTIARYWK